MKNSSSQLRSDIGPFAIVPEWLLDSEISHGAVRLYALLARYTNNDQQSWPSRATLAGRLRTSKDTVDRLIKELVCVEALIVEHRRDKTKDGNLINRSNLYTLQLAPPGVAAQTRPPSRTVAATGSRVVAAQNDNHIERQPMNDLFDSFWEAYGKKVGKKATLGQWNRHVNDEATAQRAISAARQQASTVEKKFRKDPERWLRDHRWDDDEIMVPSGAAGTMARLKARVESEQL
jgi:hypothetical protein